MTTTIICFTICLLAVVFADVFVNAIFFLVNSVGYLIKATMWVISLIILVGCGAYIAGVLWA